MSTNKRKYGEWQKVTVAINSVSSELQTRDEVKKKWCDCKCEAKKCISVHNASMQAAGGGEGTPPLSKTDERMAFILGQRVVSGIVDDEEGDTDAQGATD